MYYVLYTTDMHANHTNPQTQNGSARCHVFASLKYIYIFFKKSDRRSSEELMSVFFIQYLSMGMGFLGLGSISLTQNTVSSWLVLLPRKLILVSMTVMIRLPQHPSHKKVDQGCCCCSFPSWTLWHYGGQMVYIYIYIYIYTHTLSCISAVILWQMHSVGWEDCLCGSS